jgi:hypothetical protein
MSMFGNPSLFTRIAIGKTVGLIVGLIGFILIPIISPDLDPSLRWGVLLWYTSLGAFVGVFGVFTWHPIVKMPMPWWIRGVFVGAWMNFVLTFFAHEAMVTVMGDMFGPDAWLQSPFWFALEGAAFGLLVDYLATRYGGEGKVTVDEPG